MHFVSLIEGAEFSLDESWMGGMGHFPGQDIFKKWQAQIDNVLEISQIKNWIWELAEIAINVTKLLYWKTVYFVNISHPNPIHDLFLYVWNYWTYNRSYSVRRGNDYLAKFVYY